MLNKWGPLFLSLIIAGLLAIITILPPSPKGADTAEDQFSSARAMADLRIIAAEPHPTGSPENAVVRAYLLQRLEALGLEAFETEAALSERALARLNRWSGETTKTQNFVNVIGVLRGKDSAKPAVLLMAHHDTVWGSPGAADDTVGIASIFEILRAINAGGQAERDIIVLFTDAEELSLNGAKHFFASNPLRNRIGAIINFEARGGGGVASMFQTSADNGNAARLYAKAVKQPATSSLSTFVYNVLPNDTDLTPALEGDYVAYNIANIDRAEYYHSPKINADALQESTLQHMGMQGLDLTRALLAADSFPAPKADATFFDAFGLFTVIYAPVMGWVIILIALASLAAAYDTRSPRKDVLTGALKMIAFLVIGACALYMLNWISGAGAGADYYDRLAAIPKLELMALFVGLTAFFNFFGRKNLSANGLIGAALPLALIGVAGQILAPTASYFIGLGVMLFAIALMTQRKLNTRWAPALLLALVIGYMLGLFHQLMVGVGPDMPSVAILPLAFAVLALLPLFKVLSKRKNLIVETTFFTLAIAIALWIRFDPVASTVPLY